MRVFQSKRAGSSSPRFLSKRKTTSFWGISAMASLSGLMGTSIIGIGVFGLAVTPLALDSWWKIVILIPGAIVLVLRILDEETMLVRELDGYRDYTQKVRYRLVPYVW